MTDQGRTPSRLTIEGDGDGHVWVVCSCGWLQDFGSVAEWGEVGWHVSQHADTHRPNGVTTPARVQTPGGTP